MQGNDRAREAWWRDSVITPRRGSVITQRRGSVITPRRGFAYEITPEKLLNKSGAASALEGVARESLYTLRVFRSQSRAPTHFCFAKDALNDNLSFTTIKNT